MRWQRSYRINAYGWIKILNEKVVLMKWALSKEDIKAIERAVRQRNPQGVCYEEEGSRKYMENKCGGTNHKLRK